MKLCIGDSHSSFLAGRLGIRWVWLGPVLAYSLTRYGSYHQAREKFEWITRISDKFQFDHPRLNKGDSLICCFGEIDIRCHILRLSDLKKKAYDKMLKNLARDYVSYVSSVLDKGIKLYIWPVVVGEIEEGAFESYGSAFDRALASALFNLYLEIESLKKGAIFLGVPSLNQIPLIDGIHLDPNYFFMVKRELEEKGLKDG